MLPTIQSLWIGKPLSRLEQLCIKSFMDNGHEFHLYVYDDVGGIPDGAVIKDGNEILPEREIFRAKDGHIGPFSDWFRYEMLSQHGNFWVDMDIICVRPFDFKEEIVFGPAGGGGRYQVCVLKFPKGHECIRQLEKSCRNYGDEMPWDDAADKKRKRKIRLRGRKKTSAEYLIFGGTPVFSKAAKHYGLEKHAQPFMVLFPGMHFTYVFDRSFANDMRLPENTHSFHVSNWDLKHTPGFDKNASFGADSLFERLAKKHAVAKVPGAPHLDHDTVHKCYASGITTGKPQLRAKRRKKLLTLIVISAIAGISFLIGYAL